MDIDKNNINMSNYSENQLKKINELESIIINLIFIKSYCEKQLDNFKNNKGIYIRKKSNKIIRKYITLPVVVVGTILFGITAITTSKVLLAIILGNIIVSTLICKVAIRYIMDETEDEYNNVYNKLSDRIMKQKQKIEELFEEYKLIINDKVNKDDIEVIGSKKEDNEFVNEHIKIKKLEKQRKYL